MKYFLLLTILFSAIYGYSQDGKFNFGARNAGIAGSSITLSDEYSLFNNIAGLAGVSQPSVFAGYQNRYNISEFQVIGGGGVYPFSFGTAGVGFYKFGDDAYSQQRVHVAFGNQIQMVSLGLGLDILQYNVEGVGSRQVLAIQFGGIAEITPQLLFGAHIFNLNQAELNPETNEKVPTVMKGGVSYRPTAELMINMEVVKDLDFDEEVKVGIEYQVVERVYLRTGISTNPTVNSFGIGFHPKNFKLDYAYSRDSDLGGIHEVSISFTKL